MREYINIREYQSIHLRPKLLENRFYRVSVDCLSLNYGVQTLNLHLHSLNYRLSALNCDLHPLNSALPSLNCDLRSLN